MTAKQRDNQRKRAKKLVRKVKCMHEELFEENARLRQLLVTANEVLEERQRVASSRRRKQ